MIPLTADKIGWAVQIACLLEASAEKPGNVTRVKDFLDSRFEDFMISAVAIGPAFRDAMHASVGETILRAVRDTKRLVNTNTNLGMVLLLAPLTKAAVLGHPKGLRAAVRQVLESMTVDDARMAYEAIRLTVPAGLGEVERYDVLESNIDITLREAMKLAQDRDTVAREYVTDFKTTFGLGFVTLQQLWEQGYRVSESIVQTFLTILAKVPDTLIARKNGLAVAEQVSRLARRVLETGGILKDRGLEEVRKFDLALRDEKHRLNPGTTADLMAAVIFVFLTEGHMLERFPDLIRRW
jgi:triphosphoribosyl-dephospho-CoA synthase